MRMDLCECIIVNNIRLNGYHLPLNFCEHALGSEHLINGDELECSAFVILKLSKTCILSAEK